MWRPYAPTWRQGTGEGEAYCYANQNHFLKKTFCIWTRFETKTEVNSVLASSVTNNRFCFTGCNAVKFLSQLSKLLYQLVHSMLLRDGRFSC